MSVLPHEGTYPVSYGSTAIPAGAAYRHGYLARPDRAGRFPTAIVITDIEGVTPFEKDLARRLARLGVAVAVVDPIRPEIRAEQPEPLSAYHATTDEDLARSVAFAHRFLAAPELDWPRADSVCLIGNAVGGRVAIMEAVRTSWVASCALIETPLTGDEDREFQVADLLDRITAPLLGIYAAGSELIAPESVDEAQRRAPHGQWLVYEGVGHGFIDPDADSFDEGSSLDAVARLAGFVIATLPAPEEMVLG